MSKEIELTTLCYITRGDEVLMLHRVKKHHDINKGKYIGVGGHFKYEESPEECLLREVREETGLTLTSFQYRAMITFISGDGCLEYMSLYTADDYVGELRECDEGDLEWVKKEDIFKLNLWEGDKIFLKLLFETDKFFSLKLVYDGSEKLVGVQLDGKAYDLDLRCPCCGRYYFDEKGQYEICPVCKWEDDPKQRKDPELSGGANHESLMEARKKWM